LIFRRLTLVTVLAVLAAAGSAAAQVQRSLPPAVAAALKAANVPPSAVGASVVPLPGAGTGAPLALAVNETVPMNPASTMKLVTTLAGLEILGPQFAWRTEALSASPIIDGVLGGDLALRGSGDPRFVIEHLWLLVQRLRALGLRDIRGDLLLDRSAFEPVMHDAGAFDGETLRPYNTGPDALLLNYKSVSFSFVPDAAGQQVRVVAIPPMAGMTVPPTVRTAEGPCGDWRARLGGDFSDPLRPQFRGAFPLACGERTWHVNLLAPTSYFDAAFRALWTASDGSWRGTARDSALPPDMRVLAKHESASLAEVIRDINKFSNNVMARQLFLTIGSEVSRQPASTARAQQAIGDWLVGKGLERQEFVLENGAGLSRIERLTAAGLARLLAGAYASPLMPEFIASLPLAGVDGTMRKRSAAAGAAHVKTGLLADTRAIAGYVLSAGGRRYVVVAIVNHPQAAATQAALDELLNWVYVNG